jgi:Protein of unknown function (DUF1329)
LRDVYVINVSKVPKLARGYCYGKRVMYIDRQFYGALWEDLYDSHDQRWKFRAVFRPPSHQEPGIGPVNEALSYDEFIWDIQNKHATFFLDPTGDKPRYLSQQAPANYRMSSAITLRAA